MSAEKKYPHQIRKNNQYQWIDVSEDDDRRLNELRALNNNNSIEVTDIRTDKMRVRYVSTENGKGFVLQFTTTPQDWLAVLKNKVHQKVDEAKGTWFGDTGENRTIRPPERK